MAENYHDKPIGAWYDNGRINFTVWAPKAEKVELHLLRPGDEILPMQRDAWGYWRTDIEDPGQTVDYLFRLNGDVDRPDPASHFQPHGVHKASRVVRHGEFNWTDSSWTGIPLEEMIIYEFHIGTFTPEGTFAAAASRLEDLKKLGVNTLNIMPVAQFPGERNWGYDGVHPYAVQNSYGGPNRLKSLVDTAHNMGLAVVMDVVYNHLGPEGNYLHEFAPYFTDKYKTPWGWAVNYDDADSDGVRNFFIRNALFWLDKYHVDALRLDAIHGIFDFSAKPFLKELAEKVAEFSATNRRKRYLIAESSLNDVSIVKSLAEDGIGMDSQWSDDFHHSVHTLLTGENTGYYIDFGKMDDLTKALRDNFVYDWRYSTFRRRHHGNSAAGRSGQEFVISIQTHDQIGNRMNGDRLANLIPFEAHKLAAVCMMTAPNIPMLFMGEEYSETAPFLYFVSHGDKDLIEAVRNGRKEEFESFEWSDEPPDPQAVATFEVSKLDWNLRNKKPNDKMLALYRDLISLRKNHPDLSRCIKDNYSVENDGEVLFVLFDHPKRKLCAIMNYSDREIKIGLPKYFYKCKIILDTEDEKYAGPGAIAPASINNPEITLRPYNAVIYER